MEDTGGIPGPDDSTRCGATKPVSYNYGARALGPESQTAEARAPRTRAPQQEKLQHNKCSHHKRKARKQPQRPSAAKLNQDAFLKRNIYDGTDWL